MSKYKWKKHIKTNISKADLYNICTGLQFQYASYVDEPVDNTTASTCYFNQDDNQVMLYNGQIWRGLSGLHDFEMDTETNRIDVLANGSLIYSPMFSNGYTEHIFTVRIDMSPNTSLSFQSGEKRHDFYFVAATTIHYIALSKYGNKLFGRIDCSSL